MTAVGGALGEVGDQACKCSDKSWHVEEGVERSLFNFHVTEALFCFLFWFWLASYCRR